MLEFGALLGEYLECTEPIPSGFGDVHWAPLPGRERDAAELTQRLDRLAPAAAQAAAEVDQFLMVQPAPVSGLPPRSVNVFPQWESAFKRSTADSFGLADLRSLIDQTLGTLDYEIQEAERREATLAWKVGRVFRFPGEVRDAMGLPQRGAKTLVVKGTVAAIMITVVGGVLSGLILLVIRLTIQ